MLQMVELLLRVIEEWNTKHRHECENNDPLWTITGLSIPFNLVTY